MCHQCIMFIFRDSAFRVVCLWMVDGVFFKSFMDKVR